MKALSTVVSAEKSFHIEGPTTANVRCWARAVAYPRGPYSGNNLKMKKSAEHYRPNHQYEDTVNGFYA